MSVDRRHVLMMSLDAAVAALLSSIPAVRASAQEKPKSPDSQPRRGGNLTIALRSEPKTLNPAIASDVSTLNLIYCLGADLIHINRQTQRTEPGLAKSWTASRDGLVYTLELRQGLRFSDGRPCTAADVLFSFQAYLDEKTHSPQRDLLIVGGKPIGVEIVDDSTVRFHLAQSYAAAERLFDGFPVLPRHLLEPSFRAGNFAEAWGISTPPGQLAGMGPFRLKEYVPGQRLVLERNPYYWKQDSAGAPLPYLDGLTFVFVPSEDSQVVQFLSGDTDVLSRFSAGNFQVLERQQAAKGFHVSDLGPGLEYNFLFFNLNSVPPEKSPDLNRRQAWFQDAAFRRAVSLGIDRQAIVRLIYFGRAAPLATTVTPGNKLWTDSAISPASHSPQQARQILQGAGYSWKGDGSLADSRGNPVEFSILTSSSNEQRAKIAALIQDDLRQLGMNVHVVSLDFRATVDRLLNTFDYDAAISGIADGDADPNSEMNIWLSSGGMHLWNLNEDKPATPWEAELDRLMNQQLVTLDFARRKKLFDRVQEIEAQELPVIPLVSPNVLVGARDRVGNFHPAILDPSVLWNVDSLYVR